MSTKIEIYILFSHCQSDSMVLFPAMHRKSAVLPCSFSVVCKLPMNLRLKSIYPHKYWIFCGNIDEPVVVNMH